MLNCATLRESDVEYLCLQLKQLHEYVAQD